MAEIREKNDWAKLTAQIKQLAKVAGKGFTSEVAKRLAPIAYGIAKQNIAAGRGPTGRAWKPRKVDKAKPLASFGGALAWGANGPQLSLKVLKAQGLFHQVGAKKASKNAKSKLGKVFAKLLGSLGGYGKKAQRKIFGKTKWRLPIRRLLPKSSLPKEWHEPMVAAVRDTMAKFAPLLEGK